jgi:4-amino-4-deoxy-L-arabinose transferase-like glycosyltransferase
MDGQLHITGPNFRPQTHGDKLFGVPFQGLRPLAILVVATGFLFFGRLNAPLQEPEETRYAEIARQMLASNSFCTPVLNNHRFYDKPPLLYWLTMGSYALFGVHDWSARLPSAAAGFLTVLVLYLWSARTLGPGAGFWSALMLCLSARFIFLGRLLTMNSLLCLSVTLAFASAHLALTARRYVKLCWLACGIACGIGLLAKGPVALALVLPPVLLFCCLGRTAKGVKKSDAVILILAALAIAAPWYAWATFDEPTFASYFFWKHNFLRYIAPFDHAKPWWFYLGDCLLGTLPWSALLPFLFWSWWKGTQCTGRALTGQDGFALLAFAWTFAFFSLAGSKRSGYILPALPPLAYILGAYLDSMLKAVKTQRHMPAFSAFKTLPLILLSLVLIAGIAGSLTAGTLGMVRMPASLLLMALGLVGLYITLFCGRSLSARGSWNLCALSVFVLLIAAIELAMPRYAGRFSMRSQVRRFQLAACEPSVPVVCFPRGWDSISFYLARADILAFTAAQRDEMFRFLERHPGTLAFIKRDHALEPFLARLPASLEFVPEGRQGNVAAGWIRPRAGQAGSNLGAEGQALSSR